MNTFGFQGTGVGRAMNTAGMRDIGSNTGAMNNGLHLFGSKTTVGNGVFMMGTGEISEIKNDFLPPN